MVINTFEADLRLDMYKSRNASTCSSSADEFIYRQNVSTTHLPVVMVRLELPTHKDSRHI